MGTVRTTSQWRVGAAQRFWIGAYGVPTRHREVVLTVPKYGSCKFCQWLDGLTHPKTTAALQTSANSLGVLSEDGRQPAAGAFGLKVFRSCS